MLPDRVSNPGPLTYESGALPIALRGPAPGSNMYIYSRTHSFNKGLAGLPISTPTVSVLHNCDQVRCVHGVVDSTLWNLPTLIVKKRK